MSKNTGASKFRKVNVDEYDEGRYCEDDLDNGNLDQGPNESEVNTLLAQSRNVDALKIILNSAPLGTKTQEIKDKATQLALRVLTSFKNNEIPPTVKSLDSRSVDMLMKYIYRGFEFPSEGSSASLLTWHEKAYASGGVGTIVRVLTDRKRV